MMFIMIFEADRLHALINEFLEKLSNKHMMPSSNVVNVHSDSFLGTIAHLLIREVTVKVESLTRDDQWVDCDVGVRASR